MRSLTFTDFDAFAESVRDIDCRMMLRNPQRHVWSVTGVELDSVDVQIGQLASGNIAQGQLRSDGFMFYLPLSPGVEYVANGHVVHEDACVLMDPGSEFCISTKVAHDWLAVFVPSKYLQRSSGELTLPKQRQCQVTNTNREAANDLRKAAYSVVSMAGTAPRFETSPAGDNAAAELVRLVSSFVHVQPETVHEGRPKLRREEIIRRSLLFVEAHMVRSVRVNDLASAAGVSERTLRTAFQEYFGIGPTSYLQLRHLHEVRQALKSARYGEATVSQVLIDHGEWSYSRFAARYRELFGELPSDSLRSTA